jgi:hypothetical protein
MTTASAACLRTLLAKVISGGQEKLDYKLTKALTKPRNYCSEKKEASVHINE